jgi:ABC-type nitrate/sulfonate/bicarbonate transport system permease component
VTALEEPVVAPPDEPVGPTRRRGRPNWALGCLGLLTFAVVMEILPRSGLVDERYLPPTTDIIRALVDEAGTSQFWDATADTMQAWAIGLAIAVGAATISGLIIGIVPLLRTVTASTIEFLRPIPSVALIPLAVLLFGTGIRSSLLLIVYAAFWQVLVQVLYGTQDVDPIAIETARSFRLGRWRQLRYVIWPTTLPYLFTGLRLAAAVALVLAITSELIIGAPGLGNEIAVAQNSNAVPTIYALIVVTGILGVLINLVARFAERRALHWHASVRGEAPV